MDAGATTYGNGGPNVVFNNTGTLVVDPGSTSTATLRGSGYLIANNTGSIKLTSGTLDIYSTTLNLNGGSITGSGTLKNEGTLGINSAQSIASPVVDAGTVTGTSPLTLTGFFTTSGDTLNGPGTVTVTAGATWEDTSSMYVSGGTFFNAGTATIDATATLSIYSGATVTNSGTITMEFSSEIDGSNSPNAVFNNTGTLVVNPGSTSTATLRGYGYLVVNNTGSLQLTSGTLNISSGILNLNGGSVTGPGTLNDAGTLGINSTQTIAGPLVVSGVVTGNSPLTVSGSLTTSGANFEGPGSVTVATGATWGASASSSTTVSGGTLINAGSATLNTSASLSIGTGITVTNTGSFTMRQELEHLRQQQPERHLQQHRHSGGEPGLPADRIPLRLRLPHGEQLRLAPTHVGNSQHLLGHLEPQRWLGHRAGHAQRRGHPRDQLDPDDRRAPGRVGKLPGTARSRFQVRSQRPVPTSKDPARSPWLRGRPGASASSSTTVSGGTLINAGSATLNTSASLSIGTGITVTNTGSFTMRGSSSIYGSNSPNAIFSNTGTLVVNPGYLQTDTSTATATSR